MALKFAIQPLLKLQNWDRQKQFSFAVVTLDMNLFLTVLWQECIWKSSHPFEGFPLYWTWTSILFLLWPKRGIFFNDMSACFLEEGWERHPSPFISLDRFSSASMSSDPTPPNDNTWRQLQDERPTTLHLMNNFCCCFSFLFSKMIWNDLKSNKQ